MRFSDTWIDEPVLTLTRSASGVKPSLDRLSIAPLAGTRMVVGVIPTTLPPTVIVAPGGLDVTVSDIIAIGVGNRTVTDGVEASGVTARVRFPRCAFLKMSLASTPQGSCTVAGVTPSWL